jgi:hypothetical protein
VCFAVRALLQTFVRNVRLWPTPLAASFGRRTRPFFQVVVAALDNYFAGGLQAPPTEGGRRAAFQLLINREEMLDFMPDMRKDLIDIVDLGITGIAVWNGQDFLIVFPAVDHL